MKINFSIFIIMIFTIFGCSQSDSTVLDKIQGFSEILETKDLQKINKICTENGMTSILGWTDSLRNNQLNVIADNLSSKRITYTVLGDSRYSIDILENDEQTGALYVIIQDEKPMIYSYEGVSIVH